jgi:hypothetical protein
LLLIFYFFSSAFSSLLLISAFFRVGGSFLQPDDSLQREGKTKTKDQKPEEEK